jgi:S-adenosylmethionine:tRNA ribosyltransferase-isomerase
MHPKNISITDFTYFLPDEKIALFPLAQRDQSKLLIYEEGNISQDTYANISNVVPENSLLIFNNTKVIQARIFFQKSTGGIIELFCLEPYEENNEYVTVMSKTRSVKWKCFIGGVSKWKEEWLYKNIQVEDTLVSLQVRIVQTIPDAFVVEFFWDSDSIIFSEVLEACGEIPLPPYIKRKADAADSDRYQTIYARHDGSVAAPTAGLHFTPAILKSLENKNCSIDYVTLHVGAGTFKPVKASTMEQHEMHAEWIDVNVATIENILQSLSKTIVATGTTSLRTIESLYWMGAKVYLHPEISLQEISISQWEVYEPEMNNATIDSSVALQSLIDWLKVNNLNKLFTKTQILITPGYKFRIANKLITNFHQPQSTLLLLVAAILGDDWKCVYDYALQNEFRFLSYGDGSILNIRRN